MNPKRGVSDPPDSEQPQGRSRVILSHQQRIAGGGNGNKVEGKSTPTRKTGQPIVQMRGGGSPGTRIDQQMQAAQPKNCGAMSQQGSFSFHGNEAAPQKLVRLVGCHDPEVAADPWARPRHKAR